MRKTIYVEEHFAIVRPFINKPHTPEQRKEHWEKSNVKEPYKAGAVTKLMHVLKCWPWSNKELVHYRGRRDKWNSKEDQKFRSWYESHEGETPDTNSYKQLALDLHELNKDTKRTYDGIQQRLRREGMGANAHTKNGDLPRYDNLYKVGLKVQDGFKPTSRGKIKLEGITCGHKFERVYDNMDWRGCTICAGTQHRDFLSEKYFIDHPEEKLKPCWMYLQRFSEYCKPGLTEHPADRFATYAHLKPELQRCRLLTKYEVFRLERVFQDKFPEYRTNPEELQNPSNGFTECFDLSIESEIAKIIDEYESGTFK